MAKERESIVRTEFIHLADIHLGTEQYGSPHRYNDFARAFQWVAHYAIQRRVQFLAISGDLFNTHSLDPMTLNQAVMILQELRAARIPVLAIEGNHDRSHYKSLMSWLQFLSDQELLHLLDLVPEDGRQRALPWDANSRRGSYLDLDGVRVCGMRYFGAATARLVGEVAQELETAPAPNVQYTVFLMHAGMEGYIPHMTGGLTYAQVEPLHSAVNYLGLGHIHKAYEEHDWVYNPGSTETWRVDEASWKRGLYHISVDTSAERPHQVCHVVNPRRPFHRIWLDVDRLHSPQMLYDAAREVIEEETPGIRQCEEAARRGGLDDVRPVVHLFLRGVLPFDRQDLELDHLQQSVRDVSGALLAQIKDDTRPTEYAVTLGSAERMDRAELEQSVFRQLLERDARYRPASVEVAKHTARIKAQALEGASPESIVEVLRQVRTELT